MRRLLQISVFLWLASLVALGAEKLPPAPKLYFNDYAGVVPPAVAQGLNRRLEDFEKASSSQIVVAVFDKLPANAALEDFTVKTAQSWKVGGKRNDNGAVLFVFAQDRKMRIEVGYGLEGKLPDLICNRIISEQIAPRFRQGDYAGGLTAGVNSILQAAQGEYQGTGQTANSRNPSAMKYLPLIFIVAVVLLSMFGRGRGTIYNRRRRMPFGGWFPMGGGWGGGGWGGGGSSGGGFSGGGGRFGGGGASGSW